MTGRRPKPTELRELEGRRSHKAAVPAVVVGTKLEAVPKAPPHVQGYALEAWDDLAPMLVAANLLDATNLVAFEGLVQLIDQTKRARDEIAQGAPLVLETERGSWIENPVYAIERRAWRQVIQVAVEFGMTPSARAKLGLNVAMGLTLAQDLQQSMRDDDPRADIVLPDLDA